MATPTPVRLALSAWLTTACAAGCLSWERGRTADAGANADAAPAPAVDDTPEAGEARPDAGETRDANTGPSTDASPGDGAAFDAEPDPGDALAGDGALDANSGDADMDDTVPQDGLLLWLRADRGVMTQGSAVVSWVDQSAAHADTGQLTAAYRPLLVTTSNALPGVVFDGIDDFLAAPAGFDDFSAGVTMVTVASIRAAPLHMPVFEASNGREIDDLHLGRFDAGLITEVDTQWSTMGPIAVDVVTLWSSVLTPARALVQRENGATLGTTQFDHVPATVRRNEVFVGKSLYGETGTLHGEVHELLIYARALSDAELLRLEDTLRRRWRCCSP